MSDLFVKLLNGKASQRKLRLFGVACCRAVWDRVDGKGRWAVEIAERFADGKAHRDELHHGQRITVAAMPLSVRSVCAIDASIVARFDDTGTSEQIVRAAFIPEIFGSLFRAVAIGRAWLTWNDATIPKLAHAIYDERELPSGHLDAGRLAILADALEEAGCQDADILSHCRSSGPHVRGCWVVDLILAKEGARDRARVAEFS